MKRRGHTVSTAESLYQVRNGNLLKFQPHVKSPRLESLLVQNERGPPALGLVEQPRRMG